MPMNEIFTSFNIPVSMYMYAYIIECTKCVLVGNVTLNSRSTGYSTEPLQMSWPSITEVCKQ